MQRAQALWQTYRSAAPSVILTMLALVAVCSSVGAQKVVASQEITLHHLSRYELFSLGAAKTVLYHDQPNKVVLEAYGPELELSWSRELTLDKARPEPIGALVNEGEVNVFYTYRRNRKLQLKLHRYSERGNLSDSLVLCELTDQFLTPNWSLVPNQDNDIAILWSQRDSDTYVFIGIEVSSARILYTKVIELEFGTSQLSSAVEQVYVDQRGAAYLWMQENNRRSRIEDHQVKLIQLRPDGSVVSAVVALPDELLYSVRVAVDDLNDRVTLSGYYAEDPDAAAGSIVVALPYSLEGTATVVKVPFKPDLLLSVDQKTRAPTGIKHLEVLDVLFRRDGTAVILGEQRKRTVRTVGGRSGYFGGTLKTDYLYEDVIISTITTSGESLWQEALPKKQFSQDDNAAFSSYLLATNTEAIHLLYNDEVRSGGTVSEYTITGTGGIERHSLMNTEYQDLWLRHGAGVQLDARTVVIPSERRNRLRLVRVEF